MARPLIATPDALAFLDRPAIEEITGDLVEAADRPLLIAVSVYRLGYALTAMKRHTQRRRRLPSKRRRAAYNDSTPEPAGHVRHRRALPGRGDRRCRSDRPSRSGPVAKGSPRRR